MNKNQSIFNSLNNSKQIDFIGCCFSRLDEYFGVPRMHLRKLNLEKFLFTDLSYFKSLDAQYYEIIDQESLCEFLLDKERPIFDLCRVDFRKKDELFENLSNNDKKKFNLNIRNTEKQKFILSNTEHLYKPELIVSKVIEKKLLNVWQSKWCNPGSYSYSSSSIENMIYD
jgi:hypothetical protein